MNLICQDGSEQSVVSLEGLTHDYGGHIALSDLTVDVSPGVTGLVGANGPGKTTMLRILLGLLHPTSDRLEYVFVWESLLTNLVSGLAASSI